MQEVEGSIPSSSTNFLRQSKKLVDADEAVVRRQAEQAEPAPPPKKIMPTRPGILFFGLTEIFIGSVTLASILDAYISRGISKPLNVLVFVVLSSFISIALGIGILKRSRMARKLLVFFAGWVILSKALIMGKILSLCCALETSIPDYEKNACSIIYHLALIIYLRRPAVKKELIR